MIKKFILKFLIVFLAFNQILSQTEVLTLNTLQSSHSIDKKFYNITINNEDLINMNIEGESILIELLDFRSKGSNPLIYASMVYNITNITLILFTLM